MSTDQPRSSAWLHGPASDLLLGCGGAYLLLLLPLLAMGEEIRLQQPPVFFPLLTLLVGAPHYGATLVRVYDQRSDRRAYAIFSVWATILVAVLFSTSLSVVPLGTFLVTLYLTWSPWHYTGQNYGIAVMFLRRRGVAIDELDKRWLYASFVLSFAVIALIAHAATGDAPDVPVYSASTTIRFQPIGIPTWIADWAIPLTFSCYVATTAVAALRLKRRASLRDLAPVGLLALSQVFWFVLPLGVRWLGWQPPVEVFRGDARTHYFVWIAMAHSIQYLWVTSYFAEKSSSWHGRGRWYAKVLSAGAAVWMLPALVLGPMGFGPLSMDQGLAILIAAAVNLHHFILDGAIWKLRGRIAEVLIRSRAQNAHEESPGRPLLRRFVWALCACGLAIFLFQINFEAAFARSNRLGSQQHALDRLAWFGLDSVQNRMRLGSFLLEAGYPKRARDQFLRSVELTPVAGAWGGIGHSFLATRQPELAIPAFRSAQRLAPEHANAYLGESEAWMRLGEPESALAPGERAAALNPSNPRIEEQLEKIRAALSQADRDRRNEDPRNAQREARPREAPSSLAEAAAR